MDLVDQGGEVVMMDACGDYFVDFVLDFVDLIILDDYRFIALACVFSAVILLNLLLWANYSVNKKKGNYNVYDQITLGFLALHLGISVSAPLVVRWWVALIIAAVSNVSVPIIETREASNFLHEKVKLTKKKYIAYFMCSVIGVIIGLLLNHYLPVHFFEFQE